MTCQGRGLLVGLALAAALPLARLEAALQTISVGVVPYSLLACDLDGRGGDEIVVGALDQDVIVAVDRQGRSLWHRETGGCPLALVRGDVDGDHETEIVALIGTSKPEVLILDPHGAVRRRFTPEIIATRAVCGDFLGDRRDEIAVAGFGGRILIYDSAGQKQLDQMVMPQNFYRRMLGLAAGDFDGDGNLEIAYHGSPQPHGAIDGKGRQTIKRPLLTPRNEFLRDVADLDGDGNPELLFASLREVRAEGPKGKRWKTMVGQAPPELAREADGVVKFPFEYGGVRELAAGNFTASPGPEVASIASDGKFDLLSASGRHLIRTKTHHPFLKIAAGDIDGDGRQEILLCRLHYPEVYALSVDDATVSELQDSMAKDDVTDGLDALLAQIDALPAPQRPPPPPDRRLHVLWGMEGTIGPQLARNMVKAFNAKMQELNSNRVDYAFMFTLKERGVDRFKADGICAVGPLAPTADKLLNLCREWERDGVPFYPVVSHVGVPTVSPDTARRIFEVAPTACRGYLVWETTGNFPGRVWHDFLTRMEALAELCVTHKKRILFAEEAPFWVALTSDPEARRRLLRPKFRSVLVPVLKTLFPVGDDDDVAAYLGSMRAGEIEDWGITSEEDFWPDDLGYYRGCPDDIVMRQEIMATALGANYLMIESGHIYFEGINAAGRADNFHPASVRISREARREHLTISLFEKGILGPVAARDLLCFPPVGLRLRWNTKLDSAPYRWKAYGERRFDGHGLINMTVTSVLQNTAPDSLSRRFYGASKLMNGVFPRTPWGIIPIFGAEAEVPPDVQMTYITDGEAVFTQDRAFSAAEAMPQIAKTVQRAATALPFRADHGFCAARRDGPGRYLVTLMDTEMFAPQATRTTVRTRINGLRCADALTGKELPLHDGQVEVVVPAGAWRLLRFEQR